MKCLRRPRSEARRTGSTRLQHLQATRLGVLGQQWRLDRHQYPDGRTVVGLVAISVLGAALLNPLLCFQVDDRG